MRRLASLLVLCACAYADSPPPKGIVLVTMDTVRADHLTPYGAPPGATPNLERLATEGVVFENCHAQSNETLLSHGSMLTGRIASHVAPVDYDFTIPDGTPTLAAGMQAAGFRTGAVVASGHLARVFGLDDGFATYNEGRWWGSFQETVPMALRWIDQAVAAGEPFFLFLHGYDAHNPYVKPGFFARMETRGAENGVGEFLFDPTFYERVYRDAFYPDFPMTRRPNQNGTQMLDIGMYEELEAYSAMPRVARVPVPAADVELIKGTYRNAVFYVDLWMGVFMEELRRRGLDGTTTLAVVSDHGEALLDHGFFNHRHTLREVSTHVPFIVRPAGGTSPRRVPGLVALLDVAPTLLELAGGVPDAAMEGRSLAACLEESCDTRETVYAEGAAREASLTDGAWRLVVRGLLPSDPAFDDAVRTGEGVRFLLYDRASGERQDRAGDAANAPVIARLREALLDARGVRP